MRRLTTTAVGLVVATLAVGLLQAPSQASTRDERPDRVRPLAQAHAHNDYEHDRPLHDALSHGFTSVEADVWLVDGELLVAHDLEDVEPGRTLESLYLAPLAERVEAHRGSVYPRRADFQLLIDLKSDGPATYEAVEAALARHPGLTTITTRRDRGLDRVRRGPVEAVISGNRPLALMQERAVRRSGYDGRLADLGSGLSDRVMPLVSDNWTKHFTWTGVGPMPATERQRLHDVVRQAHRAGYRVRFWATPDAPGPARERLWDELVRAGVDHVNTDDLAGLEAHLRGVR